MSLNRRGFVFSSISIALLASFPKLALANCDSDYQLSQLREYVPSLAIIVGGAIAMNFVGIIALPVVLLGFISLNNKMKDVQDEVTSDVLSKIKNFSI